MVDELPRKSCVPGADYIGFIGRFLTKYIHTNNLASEIRIVDKQLPQLAWLAPEFADVCTMERFEQGDMSRERAFLSPFGFFLSIFPHSLVNTNLI